MSSRQQGSKKRKAEEKVDISQLQFGDDFENAEAMLNAEVKVSLRTSPALHRWSSQNSTLEIV
jgi:hypothetical protein